MNLNGRGNGPILLATFVGCVDPSDEQPFPLKFDPMSRSCSLCISRFFPFQSRRIGFAVALALLALAWGAQCERD